MIQWHFLICIVSFCMLYSLFVNVLYVCLLAYRVIVYFTTSMVYLLSPGHISITGTDHIELLLFQACKFIFHVISSSFPKLVLFAVKCHCNSQVFIYEKKCLCKMTNAAFLFILWTLIWIHCMYNSEYER